MNESSISKSSVRRFPTYLNYLKSLPEDVVYISATSIALGLGLGDVQVRKDLGAVCSAGRPKVGYAVSDLISSLESFLGYDNIEKAVIVGCGNLGRALLDYKGFNEYGIDIIAGFDVLNTGVTPRGKPIYPMDKFIDTCINSGIRIGIIAVPPESAREICRLMVENGILAIWNFTPAHLDVPEHILVENENMAVSLAILSKHLKQKIENIKD